MRFLGDIHKTNQRFLMKRVESVIVARQFNRTMERQTTKGIWYGTLKIKKTLHVSTLYFENPIPFRNHQSYSQREKCQKAVQVPEGCQP